MEADNASCNYKSGSPQAAQVLSSLPSPQPRVRQLSTAVHSVEDFQSLAFCLGSPKKTNIPF